MPPNLASVCSPSGTSRCKSHMQSKQNQIYNIGHGIANLKYTVELL